MGGVPASFHQRRGPRAGLSQAAHDGQGCPLTAPQDPDLAADRREDVPSFHQSSLL